MWLAYAVGYLEKNKHEVLFIDAPAAGMTKEDVCNKAAEFKPDMAVLEASTPSIYNDIEVACAIKKEVPDVFTILVGVHVSAVPTRTLQEAPPGLDAVAVHEYDATLVDLASKLKESRSDEVLKSVPGIAFRSKNGEVIQNEDRPFIEDLDDIPPVSSVYKKHLDIAPYFYGHSRHPLIVLLSGRGCPFHCTYCVYPQTLVGHTYRKRSIKSIVDEFLYIAENFPNVREIMIEDDTLTADRKRCRELSHALIDAKATSIPWSANSRADVDLETMKIMKKANCRLYCVGFESGDQQVLDTIKKAIKLADIVEFRKNAKKARILIHGCFMVGNKGETRETLEKTLQMAKDLNPDTAQFYPIMVYPGTEAYDYFKNMGWITTQDYRKWITEEGLHSSVVSNPSLTYEELVAFCDRARREFYLRPKYIISKGIQIFTHPGEMKRVVKAFRTFYKYIFR
ncbi:MAG: radical SAM protein [Chitinispirillaceae bacterium]|nr:radical SAM protein [Chitinispirillaceae bacterium]